MGSVCLPAVSPADSEHGDRYRRDLRSLHEALDAERCAIDEFSAELEAQRSGPCHQPQTGLLFLVSGAPEISPKTGLATENGVKINLLTCENAPPWGW